jgi:diketogulonate reductase-like aldo/keto reductase
MQERPFGDGGPPVSVVGQGTWMMEQDERGAAITAIRRGIDLGMTHLDTAEMYGSGRVEALLGEAIRGCRDRVFLVSKVLPTRASRKGTVEACERSLKALGTDRLDAYLLHWPGPHPLEETIDAFESLVGAGKIRSWGLSNFDVEGLEAALKIAGPGRIRCNQVLYNLGERTVEHAVLPWCAAHGVAPVAYSPVFAQAFPASAALEALARDRGATPRQLALAYLLRHPSVLVIPKSSRVAHVEENARAASLELGAEEIAAIEAEFPLGPWRGLATA